MSVAIVGDTHMPKGSRRLPDRCLELLAAAELIVHTGDFSRLEVLASLRAIGPPVVAVHGNVDEAQLRRELPEATTFEMPGTDLRAGLVHDAGPKRGRIERMRRRFPDADLVIFGHSHLPLIESCDLPDGGSFQILNPGSPTERRRAPRPSMAITEIETPRSLRLSHVWLGPSPPRG